MVINSQWYKTDRIVSNTDHRLCPRQHVIQTYRNNDLLNNFFFLGRLEDVDLLPLGAKDVLVKMLAAPVNPSDINMIQGT